MTREDKDLLLKDLCARLPYDVKCKIEMWKGCDVCTIYNINSIGYVEIVEDSDTNGVNIERIKPYLFPLSSMTEEQKEELYIVTNGKFSAGYEYIDNCKPRSWSEWGTTEYNWIRHYDIDLLHTWLNKNHFDYRGLIPKGIALDATGLNIY